MLKKRIVITLTFLDGVLFRTKKFKPDYRYTKNFIDLWSIDELILIDISEKKFSESFLDLINFFSINCFVPLSVGGGINQLSEADIFFKNGADKIILGSNTLNHPDLISRISKKYGNNIHLLFTATVFKNMKILFMNTRFSEMRKIEFLIWIPHTEFWAFFKGLPSVFRKQRGRSTARPSTRYHPAPANLPP